MTKRTKITIRSANAIAVLLCGIWFIFDPNFEPIITALVLSAGFLVPIKSPDDGVGKAAGKEGANDKTAERAANFGNAGVAHSMRQGGGGLEVQSNDLLVLKGPQGTAVVEFNFMKGCRATYRWKHAATARGASVSGTGEVFEQYARQHRTSPVVTDAGGELHVQAGPYSIEWSCGGPESGWVYPSSSNAEAYVAPDIAFDGFRL